MEIYLGTTGHADGIELPMKRKPTRACRSSQISLIDGPCGTVQNISECSWMEFLARLVACCYSFTPV